MRPIASLIREEMAELEAERVAAAGTVEEAKKSSRAVKLLDSRVQVR